MIVEILSRVGDKPLRLDAAQLIIRGPAGTPIVIAGNYGAEGMIKVARAGDPDFQRTLEAFGHGRHTIEVMQYENEAPPPGARLVAGPDDIER